MLNKSHLFFILIIELFFSCTSEEVVNLNDMYQCKPVVYSVISPQNDTIRVFVSRTYAFGEEFDESKLAIDNALVTISTNDKTIQLPFSLSSGQYEIATNNFPIIEGQIYHLEVVLPTGEKATAETTIPIGNFQIDSVVTAKTGPFRDYDFPDYYYYRFSTSVFCKICNSGNEVILNNNLIFGMSIDYEIIGDKLCIKYYKNQYAFHNEFKDDSTRHYLYITDESLQNYENNAQFVYSFQHPDNEFDVFKGVYPEFTNIENGYGVFSSYLRSEPFYIYYRF
jgi:hypothetical protein